MTKPKNEPSALSIEIAKYLRDWMVEHDLTVEQVAVAMGRSRTYVYEHTSGVRAMDLDILNAVARLGSTSPRALYVELASRMM